MRGWTGQRESQLEASEWISIGYKGIFAQGSGSVEKSEYVKAGAPLRLKEGIISMSSNTLVVRVFQEYGESALKSG